MIIKTSLDKSDVINRIRERVYTTEDYSHMKWQEKYCCEKDYYGDVFENHIILHRTNSSGERTGTQHLLFRGKVCSDGNDTIIKFITIPNVNHLVYLLAAIILVVYAYNTMKWMWLIGSFLIIIVDIASIVNDYDSFHQFIRNSLK